MHIHRRSDCHSVAALVLTEVVLHCVHWRVCWALRALSVWALSWTWQQWSAGRVPVLRMSRGPGRLQLRSQRAQ